MYAGRQVPAAPPPFETQFFEQQSPAPTVHASKRVLQAFPPGRAAQAFPVQTPVQHSLGAPQDAPVCLQLPPPQRFPVQASEQHSPGEVQAPPSGLQNAAVVQVPAPPPAGTAHIAEQQSVPVRQVAPWPPQVTVGEAHCCVVPSQ